MNDVLPVLGLALVAVVGLLLVERFIRDPVFAAGAVIAVSVLGTFLDDAFRPPVIGGVTVTTNDAIFSLLLTATLLRAMRRRGWTNGDRLLTLLALVVAWSTLRGVQAFGPQPALRETRIFLYFVGGALYFATSALRRDQLERIARLWVVAAVGFMGITVFRWAAMVGGISPTGIFARSREIGVRVIDNQNTLVVLQAVFLVVPAMLAGRAEPWMRRAVWVSVPLLLGLQHRTIWLVAVAAAAVFTAQRPELGRKVTAGVLTAGLLGGVLMIAFLDDQESSALQQAPTDTRSLVWRVDGWQGLLTQQEQTSTTVLVGKPMGGGFERELETSGNLRDTSPHNFYIQSFLRVGLLGLVVLLLAYASTIARLQRLRDPPLDALVTPATAVVLLTTQLVFMLAWGPDTDQGMVLGLVMSMAWQPPLDAGRPTATGTSRPALVARRGQRR